MNDITVEEERLRLISEQLASLHAPLAMASVDAIYFAHS